MQFRLYYGGIGGAHNKCVNGQFDPRLFDQVIAATYPLNENEEAQLRKGGQQAFRSIFLLKLFPHAEVFRPTAGKKIDGKEIDHNHFDGIALNQWYIKVGGLLYGTGYSAGGRLHGWPNKSRALLEDPPAVIQAWPLNYKREE